MLTYATLRKKPKELLALTGLARREFEELLPAFAQALTAAEARAKPKPSKRQRAAGGGRKPGLRTVEDKLLFVLVYTKTYPLQVVQGQLFGMSQSSANEWIHFLLRCWPRRWMRWASVPNARVPRPLGMSAAGEKHPT